MLDFHINKTHDTRQTINNMDLAVRQTKTLSQRSKGSSSPSTSITLKTNPANTHTATIAALTTHFTTKNNTASIAPTLTLWAAIQTAYTTARNTFLLQEDATLPLSSPSAGTHIINAVFDTDAQLLFTGPHATLFASLAPAAKARLLAQGIAGIVLFLRGLGETAEAEGGPVTATLFARELELFRVSEERGAVLDAVDDSHVWEGCAAKEDITRAITRAVESADDEVEVVGEVEGVGALFGFEIGRPKNMGLPWGFSILPVN